MWILFVLLIQGSPVAVPAMKQVISDQAACESRAAVLNETIELGMRYYAFCYPASEESR